MSAPSCPVCGLGFTHIEWEDRHTRRGDGEDVHETCCVDCSMHPQAAPVAGQGALFPGAGTPFVSGGAEPVEMFALPARPTVSESERYVIERTAEQTRHDHASVAIPSYLARTVCVPQTAADEETP